MSVRLTGRLICGDEYQRTIVARHLPTHVELTRAEPGCLSFEVTPTDVPGVWSVAEEFADRAALQAHQARVAASTWGRATRDVVREYEVTEDG